VSNSHAYCARAAFVRWTDAYPSLHMKLAVGGQASDDPDVGKSGYGIRRLRRQSPERPAVDVRGRRSLLHLTRTRSTAAWWVIRRWGASAGVRHAGARRRATYFAKRGACGCTLRGVYVDSSRMGNW